MIYTTLTKIRKHKPCATSWRNLLAHLDKKRADSKPLSILTILKSNGFDDAMWALRACDANKQARLFAVKCARRVQHLMTDPRSITALDVAERHANGQATDKELTEACTAANVAAWNARDGGATAAAYAARDAARYDARDAAAYAAESAEWAAVRNALNGAAERKWQRRLFVKMFCQEDKK